MQPAAILRSALLFAVVISIAPPKNSSAQTLEQLRSEVRINDPEPARSPAAKPDRDCDDHHDDDCDSDTYSGEEVQLFGMLTGFVVTSPFWLPMTIADDNLGRAGYFPAFPYQYDVGYMLIHPDEYHGVSGPRRPFTYAVRARSDYGTNFNGLDWVGGNVLAEFSTRFGLESEFRFYQDDLLAAGNQPPDTAWLGDANIFYRFAQNDWMQFRSGVGVNWLSDRLHTDVGFNFTYAADFYPTKPWVISGEFDWGILGDETLLHARFTTGLQHKGLEAYIGYDLIDIGKFQSNSLIAGVRLWF
jgi:hypothetical protein